MNAARALMIAAYAVAYGIAAYAGTAAVGEGEALYAVGLFGTSAGLLAGIHREYRQAAQLMQAAPAYGHRGHALDAVTVERMSGLPPGCSCEAWWTTLGGQHTADCPASRRELW